MSEIELRRQEAQWSQFFEMIQEECPHCKVENLIVVDGAPCGYDMIRYSRVPPRESASAGRAGKAAFNESWRWLINQCRELKNGIIPEVHFRDGNPFVLYGIKQGNTCLMADKDNGDNFRGGDRTESRTAPAFA